MRPARSLAAIYMRLSVVGGGRAARGAGVSGGLSVGVASGGSGLGDIQCGSGRACADLWRTLVRTCGELLCDFCGWPPAAQAARPAAGLRAEPDAPLRVHIACATRTVWRRTAAAAGRRGRRPRRRACESPFRARFAACALPLRRPAQALTRGDRHASAGLVRAQVRSRIGKKLMVRRQRMAFRRRGKPGIQLRVLVSPRCTKRSQSDNDDHFV